MIYAGIRLIGDFNISGGAYPTPGYPHGIYDIYTKYTIYISKQIDNNTFHVHKKDQKEFYRYNNSKI